ncbi:MAG: hypothetical protein HQL86_06405 [Magnetococcales bacterium]|nr:hypothetical protein [Magnetococcales bacterium]
MKAEIKNPDAVWSIRGVSLGTRRTMASRARAKGMTVPTYLEFLLGLDQGQDPSQAVEVSDQWQVVMNRLEALEKVVQQAGGPGVAATTTAPSVDLYAVVSERIRQITGRVNWPARAEVLNAEGLIRPDLPWTGHSLRAWMDRMRRDFPNG